MSIFEKQFQSYRKRIDTVWKDLHEGIPMGKKALSQPYKKNYSIGFEFEVAVSDEAGYDSDEEESFEDAYEEFTERWYSGGSTFNFEEWFNDSYINEGGQSPEVIVDEYDLSPRHGIVKDKKELLRAFEKEFNERRKTTIKVNYGEENAKKGIEFYNKFKEDKKAFLENDELIFKFFQYYYLELFRYRYKFATNWSPSRQPVGLQRTSRDIREAMKGKTDEEIQGFVESHMNSIRNDLIFHEDYIDFHYDEDEYTHVWADAEKEKAIAVEEIEDLDELTEFFNVTEEEMRDLLHEEWQEYEHELMKDEFDYWYMMRDRAGQSSTSYVRQQAEEKLGITNSWRVIEDDTTGVSAELISPPLPLEKGIRTMHDVMEFIEDDTEITTSSATGLHINIGTWSPDDIDNVDWLKFLMIYHPELALREFNRIGNMYAPDKLKSIVSDLENNDIKSLYQNELSAINNMVISKSEKYSSVNLSKLKDHGYIEIRAPGGEGYETKGEVAERQIRRAIRALEIASDPQAYKKEYIKRLYSTFQKVKSPENTSVEILTSLFNSVGVDYKKEGLLRSVLMVLSGSTNSELDAFNRGYTAKIHKLIVSGLMGSGIGERKNIGNLLQQAAEQNPNSKKTTMYRQLIKRYNPDPGLQNNRTDTTLPSKPLRRDDVPVNVDGPAREYAASDSADNNS